jgi:hypothetical protein
MTAEQWDEQRALMGRVEMFPAEEWDNFLEEKEELSMAGRYTPEEAVQRKMIERQMLGIGEIGIISESIMKAAHEGIEAQPTVSDIEKAARAICDRLGHDPDLMVCAIEPQRINHLLWVAPKADHTFPLWTYFTREAEAALNAVHK